MRDRVKIYFNSVRPNSTPMIFGPGVFFLLIGLAVLFAPRLVLAIVAAFFLFIGIAGIYLAYRFLEVKRNFAKTFNDLKSRVSVQALQVVDPMMDDPQIDEQLRAKVERIRVDKKIIIH